MTSIVAATVVSGTRHRQRSGSRSHRTTTAATVRPDGFTRKPSASPTISPRALRTRPARRRSTPRPQVVLDSLRNRRGDAVAARVAVSPDTWRDSHFRPWGADPKIAVNKGHHLSRSTQRPNGRVDRRRSSAGQRACHGEVEIFFGKKTCGFRSQARWDSGSATSHHGATVCGNTAA